MGLTDFLREFYQQESHLPKEALEHAIIEAKDLELRINRLQETVALLRKQKKSLEEESKDLDNQINEANENYSTLSKLHIREIQKISEAKKLVNKWRGADMRGSLGVVSSALDCANELEKIIKD